jgi:hypothetical protein
MFILGVFRRGEPGYPLQALTQNGQREVSSFI